MVVEAVPGRVNVEVPNDLDTFYLRILEWMDTGADLCLAGGAGSIG